MSPTKRCSGCKTQKCITNFRQYNKTKDKLFYYCKECEVLKSKENYQKHAEKRKEEKRIWRKNNPELVKQRNREQYLKNKEKRIEYASDYYYDNHEARKAYKNQWYEANKNGKVLSSRLKTLFNISIEDYEKMYKEQDGKCAICHIDEDTLKTIRPKSAKLCIDHCYITGKVRGLLCSTCNTGIGMLNDSINQLQNAIYYLDKNNIKNGTDDELPFYREGENQLD